MSKPVADARSVFLSEKHNRSLWKAVSNPKFNSSPFHEAAADLHNNGQINIIDLYYHHPYDEAVPQFFIAVTFFCKVLPLIVAPVRDIIRVCNRLANAGPEGHTLQINAAFQMWCSRSRDRPLTVLKSIEDEPSGAYGMLSAALETGAAYDPSQYVREALRLLDSNRQEVRVSAISALGRIDVSDSLDLQTQIVSALKQAHTTTDSDLVSAHIVSAIAGIWSRSSASVECAFRNILCDASHNPGPRTRYAIADVLRQHHTMLSAEALDSVFGVLADTDSTARNILSTIDLALTYIDLRVNEYRIAGFLRRFLHERSQGLAIGLFAGFTRRLVTTEIVFFMRLACRWLRTRDPILCSAIESVFETTGVQEISSEIDFKPVGFSDDEVVYVCKKAYGYLHFVPSIVAQFVVAGLRVCRPEGVTLLCAFLLDPVIVYSGDRVRRYLLRVAKSSDDVAAEHVSSVLKIFDERIRLLSSLDDLLELHPSGHEEQIASDVRTEMFTAAFEKAKNESIVSRIAMEVPVLYGSGTVNYMGSGPAAQRKRVVSKFGTHATSVEYPILESADPERKRFLIFSLRNLRFSA